jgi:hypothetical protein
VGVAETINELIAVMISSATIPAFKPGIGTQLYHAERCCSPGKCVTMPAGTYKRIDIGCDGLLGSNAESQGAENECDVEIERFHFVSLRCKKWPEVPLKNALAENIQT